MPQVLIVDDDPDLLNVCRVGLGALGHAVQTAESGGEGLSETAITRPDVIVLVPADVRRHSPVRRRQLAGRLGWV